jgi:hypothetical protein
VAITVVGNLDSSTGTATTTLTLTAAAAIGDVRVLVTKINSATINVSSLSGGNATSWTKVAGPDNDTNATVARHEIWIGTVANANTSQHETITVTWSASVTGISIDLDCRTFSNGNTATTWARDGAALTFKNNASSTTITYPTGTAAGAGELYVGHARCPSGGSYGTPTGSGATWVTTTDANGNPYIYTLSSASGSNAPTQSTTATLSYATGVLLIPSAGPTTFTKTLSVTGVGVVSLAKQDAKTVGVTGVGVVSLLRTFERPLSVTGVGVVKLTKSAQLVKAVTGVGVVSLAKLESKALSVTGVGVPSLAKLDSKILPVTGMGAVSLLRQFNRSLSVVGSGVVGLTKLPAKVLKVTGAGTVGLAKLDGKILVVTGTGVVSLGQSTIIPPRLAFVLLYDEVAYSVAMSDELVYSATLTDDLAFSVSLRDDPVYVMVLTDELVTGANLMDEHPDVNL